MSSRTAVTLVKLVRFSTFKKLFTEAKKKEGNGIETKSTLVGLPEHTGANRIRLKPMGVTDDFVN